MRNIKKYFPVYIVVIVSVFYFWTRFWRFTSGFICPVFEFDSFSDLGIIMVFAISFITSLFLGYKNIRLKWLYPTFTASFIWLVPSIAYLLFNSQIDNYIFMYYMLYTFFIIFLGQQIFASLGIGVGVLIFRLRAKSN
ncbi:MAG: hypothetical protein FWE92_02505 [Defluviitaleaceae bacterium]|nr:hypothetical protein [Defluviitaleaceae bacterium]